MDPRYSFSSFNRNVSLASGNSGPAARSVSPVDTDWAQREATPSPPSPPQAALSAMSSSRFGITDGTAYGSGQFNFPSNFYGNINPTAEAVVRRTGQGPYCQGLVPRRWEVQMGNHTSITNGVHGQLDNTSSYMNLEYGSARGRPDHGGLPLDLYANNVYNAGHDIPGGASNPAKTEASYNSATTNDAYTRMDLSHYVDPGNSQPSANHEGDTNHFSSVPNIGNAELLAYVGPNMEVIHGVKAQDWEVAAAQDLAYPLSDPNFQLSQEGNYDVQPSDITFDDVHPSNISLGQIDAWFDELPEQKACGSLQAPVMGSEADLGKSGQPEHTTLANETLNAVNEDMKKGVIARDRISHEDMPHAQIADEGASDCKMRDSHITDDKTEVHNAVDRSTCVPVTTQATIDQSPLIDDVAGDLSIEPAVAYDNDGDDKATEANSADGEVEEEKITNSEMMNPVMDGMTEGTLLEADASGVIAPDGDVADVGMSDDRVRRDGISEPKVEDQEMTDQVGVGEVLDEKTSGIEIAINSSAENQAHAIAPKPLAMPNDETELPNMMQPATEPRTATRTEDEVGITESAEQGSNDENAVATSHNTTEVVMEEDVNQKTPQAPVRNPAFLIDIDEAKITRIAAMAEDLRAMFGAEPAGTKKRPLTDIMKQGFERTLLPATKPSAQAVIPDTTESDLPMHDSARNSSRLSSVAASPVGNARPSPPRSSRRLPARRRNRNYDLDFPDFNKSFRDIGNAIRDLGAENMETRSKLIQATEKLKENEQRFKDNERKLNAQETRLKKHENMLERKNSEIAILKQTLDKKIERVTTKQHKLVDLYQKLVESKAERAQAVEKAKEGEKAKEAEKTKETKTPRVTKKRKAAEGETEAVEANEAGEAKRTRNSTIPSVRGGSVQGKRGGRGGQKK